MLNTIIQEAKQHMQKSVASLKTELTKLRTGRAHPSLLDHIRVDYYGSMMPISQVANVSVEDARTLSITPWERAMIPAIEKAIMTSDLGLNPSTAGTVIRIPMPALTEQRRRDLVKVVKEEAEKSRVAIRNARRDANNHVKELLKDKTISEDDQRRAETEVQKLTDDFVGQVDKVAHEKEADLMAI